MKKFTFLCLCGLVLVGCGSSDPWKQADKIVSSMTKVSIPEREVTITDLGAVPGDSLNPCHDVINLAIINMLPLPALDGGKIFFLVVNAVSRKVFGKQIPAKFENYVHYAGLILLLGLMVVITFQDVWKIFT